MMTTIETYVRRGTGSLRKWVADPGVRLVAKYGAWGLAGLIFSAASLANVPQPLALGLVCALAGTEAVAAAAGGTAGYLLFWGKAGYQGLCWLILGLGAALGLGKRRILEESPYLMMSVAGLIVSASGLGFQIWAGDATQVPQYLLRIGLGVGSAKLFEVVRDRRDRRADWLALATGVLSLSQIAPFGFSLGYVAAGALAGMGGLPLSALTGLALSAILYVRDLTGTVGCALCQLAPYFFSYRVSGAAGRSGRRWDWWREICWGSGSPGNRPRFTAAERRE